MADRGRLLDEFDEGSGSSGEETTFEEMQSRMSSLETMLQHARRERLSAVRHARSQLQRARVLMQRNHQTKFFLRKVISELEKSLEEYQDKPNTDSNDRTKVSLLFEGRLSKMFEDVSPLMSPGYTSPSVGSPLDSEFEVYKTPRRLSYGDELFFDEDGTSYLGNQNGSVSRNELFEYRLGNYESAGMGVPYRRHEITVHRVEIRESRSNRRKSRKDTRPQREKSAEGELRDTQWTERVPYGYDDLRRSTVSLRSSNYIQHPVLPQTRASRAEAASFPRSPAGSMTSPARPSKSNPRAKGSSPKNKPRAQQYDNRQMSRNKEHRNEKQIQRRLDSRIIASTAGDTVNRRDSGSHRDTGSQRESGTHRLPMSEDKRSISFSHSVHTALVKEMINAQQLKGRPTTPNITDLGFVPAIAGSRKSSPLVIPHGSSSASDKSRIQSGRSRQTSDESTYAPRSTSDDNSRERRNRAISRHESTVVPPNSIERSERSVPSSRDSSSTVPSSVDDRSRADSQWNQNYVKQGSTTAHNLAEKKKSLQSRVSKPDTSISFQASSKPREKSLSRQERGSNPHKEEHPRAVSIVTPAEKSPTQTRSQPPAQTPVPRMQASATTQTIMSPVPPTGRQSPNQTQAQSPRPQPPPKTPSRPQIDPPLVIQSLSTSQNIQSPLHEDKAQPQNQAQPPTSNNPQSLIRTSPPERPPSPAQPPPSTLTPKSQSLSQPSKEDTLPIVDHTSREKQPQSPKQPPPRPPPPTRLPPSPAPPRSSTPSLAPPRSSTPSLAPPLSSTPSPAPPRSSTPSLAPPRSSTPSLAPPLSSTPSPAPPRSSTPSPAPPRSSTPSPAPPRSSTPSPAPPRSSTPSPAPPRSPTPSPAPPRSSTPKLAPPRSSTPSSSPPSRSATPPQMRPSISAKVSISTPQQMKTPSIATPQSQMTPSRSITPSPSTPLAMRGSLSSSRPPSSAKASPKPSITSRSSAGSRNLPFSRPQSIQSRKPSPKISPLSKSPSPPRASFAKQPALTAALIDTITKGPSRETKFPVKTSLAQQSYQVARSGPSSPQTRSTIPSASHRSVSGYMNKMGSIGSDASRRSLMRTSAAQERRNTLMKQEASSPTPSKLMERPSMMEAKKFSVSPAHRSGESRSPSIKTPTGSPLSRVSKITELQKEKARTTSPVTSEKKLTTKEARISSVGVVDGRRMYSSASRQISSSKISVKDDKKKSISSSPLTPNLRRQSMSERVVTAANATRSISNALASSRDTIGGSPVKSDGTKAMKPRQSSISTRQSAMTAEPSLLSPTERRQTMQRRPSATTTPRVSSMEKRQTKTTRAKKTASPTDESKKLSQVPGSDSYDAHIPGVELLQKTIEPTPSDKHVASSESPLPEKRVTLSKSISSDKREAPIPSSSKPVDILSSDKRMSPAEPIPKPVAPTSSDKRISSGEPIVKPVAPTSSEKRISSTRSHPKVAGHPSAQKNLSIIESLSKTETQPFSGLPAVPLRLVSSDKHVPVSEKRDTLRQAPSLVEIPSGKQTQIPKKSSAVPTEKITPKVSPARATVPIDEKIKKTSSEKHVPVEYETSKKGLEKMSGEGKVETKQPSPEVREDRTIKRSHTLSAPISETKMIPEERKPLTSQSEPKELEKIPLQTSKVPRKGVEVSKPATPHSEHIFLEKLQPEMPMTTRSSLEHSSGALSSDRLAATAKRGSFSDMDAQATSSTNVAERTDTIGDLPSIKRHKYHKYRKDESAMNDDAERRKSSSGPSESDLGESSEVEDHSLHGLIEFFC